MPKPKKNFYIEANIDGRKSKLKGGPQAKDGGFDMSVKILQKGEIKTAIMITGSADEDGDLLLEITNFQELKDLVTATIVGSR